MPHPNAGVEEHLVLDGEMEQRHLRFRFGGHNTSIDSPNKRVKEVPTGGKNECECAKIERNHISMNSARGLQVGTEVNTHADRRNSIHVWFAGGQALTNSEYKPRSLIEAEV